MNKQTREIYVYIHESRILTRDTHEMKSSLLSNISHEFRTPLSLIINPLKQMDCPLPRQGTKKTLTLMLRNARRLHFLINQLLEFSKIDSGNVKYSN